MLHTDFAVIVSSDFNAFFMISNQNLDLAKYIKIAIVNHFHIVIHQPENINVECPQCGTAYVIRFPRPAFIVNILDSGDMLIQRMCPIITGMDYEM